MLQLSRGTGTDPEEGQADPGVEVFHTLGFNYQGELRVYAETTEANRITNAREKEKSEKYLHTRRTVEARGGG